MVGGFSKGLIDSSTGYFVPTAYPEGSAYANANPRAGQCPHWGQIALAARLSSIDTETLRYSERFCGYEEEGFAPPERTAVCACMMVTEAFEACAKLACHAVQYPVKLYRGSIRFSSAPDRFEKKAESISKSIRGAEVISTWRDVLVMRDQDDKSVCQEGVRVLRELYQKLGLGDTSLVGLEEYYLKLMEGELLTGAPPCCEMAPK